VFTAYNTVLEAFDQFWKQSPDFTTWGLLRSDRAPKTAYKVFLTFVDDPLVAGSNAIRAVHIMDLRRRIDALRVRFGQAEYNWTNPTLTAGATIVRAAHIADLRDALSEAYVAAGLSPPTYSTDPTLVVGTPVKAAHIAELRARVMAIE